MSRLARFDRRTMRSKNVLERSMSLRMAVAAATIGAGLLATNSAQAGPEMVGVRGDYSPGTIVVKTNERRLYLILDSGHAVRYPVGVGKSGKQWAGTTQISEIGRASCR